MKKARPNSVSVLPTHSQFKDKPVGSASGAPGNTARWTLRRVILGAGGLLFVYITLTTIFKSSSSTGRPPRATRPEPDFYKDVQLNNGKPYKDANRAPIVDNANKPWLDPSNNRNGDNIGVGAGEVKKPEQEPIIEDKTPKQPEKQQPPAGGSGSGSDQTTEEGDDADTDLDEPEVESDVSITSRKRLSTGVTYAQVLASTKAERDYAIALIVKEANQALKSTEVYSVTNKDQTAPSNDIHDYLSLSKYYWPNDKSPTGDFLPYVRRDGHINPEIETVRDYRLLRTMMREVHIMGMAYHFTGNKTYADKCAKRLREWFLDEATYMNPNINFGSLRKGEALGARTGVLDMFPIFR
ncbi:hypothetical protein BGZ74_002199, partial [Mortierella antarctica]